MPFSLLRHLPDAERDHLVGRPCIFIDQFLCCFHARNRHTILKLFSVRRSSASWERVGKRQVLREQAKLTEYSALVPGDVLVVEAIAADIDDACKRNAELLGRWGDARDPAREVSASLVPIDNAEQYDIQPVNNPVMGAVEQKLVDDAVHPDRPAHQLQRRIVRVAEYEVVSVKGGQF